MRASTNRRIHLAVLCVGIDFDLVGYRSAASGQRCTCMWWIGSDPVLQRDNEDRPPVYYAVKHSWRNSSAPKSLKVAVEAVPEALQYRVLVLKW